MRLNLADRGNQYLELLQSLILKRARQQRMKQIGILPLGALQLL